MECKDLEINIVFGGGINQLELIHLLNIHNEYVLLIDIKEHCPGKEFANEFILSRGDEYQLIINKVGNRKVKRILTSQNENTLESIVDLCKYFGIPYYDKKALENIRDKNKSKLILQRNNIKVPLFEIVTNGQKPRLIDFPFIIKPLKQHSSIGVKRIENIESLQLHFNEFSRFEEFQIEQIIEGEEFSVEGIVSEGIITIHQITKKELFSLASPVEKSHTQTKISTFIFLDELQLVIEKTCKALSMDNTAFHIEVIRSIKDNVFYPIDIGPRLGGDYISSYLMELSLGISLTELLLFGGARGEIKPMERNLFSKVCYLESKRKGEIRHIGKIDDLYFIPGLRLINILKEVGDIVGIAKSSSDRLACFIITANTAKRLEDLEKYVTRILMTRIKVDTK